MPQTRWNRAVGPDAPSRPPTSVRGLAIVLSIGILALTAFLTVRALSLEKAAREELAVPASSSTPATPSTTIAPSSAQSLGSPATPTRCPGSRGGWRTAVGNQHTTCLFAGAVLAEWLDISAAQRKLAAREAVTLSVLAPLSSTAVTASCSGSRQVVCPSTNEMVVVLRKSPAASTTSPT